MADFIPHKAMIYSGPVDAFFDYRFGKLPYRSLEFKHVTMAQNQLQSVGTVNFPNDHAYTRVTEFKHLTGSKTRPYQRRVRVPTGGRGPLLSRAQTRE